MTLGLCMIVKNESEVLRRAIDGAKNFCSEIVVVDTGSTDDTKAIAREYTDKVYDFKWIDDFSAARNFALSKASTDYWLWLDADDIIPPKTAHAIERYLKTAPPELDVVMLPYVLSVDRKGKPAFSYYRERIIRNRSDFRWSGKVHEAVELHGRIEKLPYPIVHAKPDGRAAGTRNLDIYERAVARGEVFGPRELYYYARELYFNGKYSDAALNFEWFLSRHDGFYVNKIDACVMLSRSYRAMGERDLAVRAAARSFDYGMPSGEACCELGALFFDVADYKSAVFWYNCATRIKPDTQNGAFVDRDSYAFIPFLWLSVCYDRMGEYKKAFRYHVRAERLKPDHPSVLHNRRYFETLGFTSENF